MRSLTGVPLNPRVGEVVADRIERRAMRKEAVSPNAQR